MIVVLAGVCQKEMQSSQSLLRTLRPTTPGPDKELCASTPNTLFAKLNVYCQTTKLFAGMERFNFGVLIQRISKTGFLTLQYRVLSFRNASRKYV